VKETFGWNNFKVGDLVNSEGKIYSVVGCDPNNTANLTLLDSHNVLWIVHNCLCDPV
jgi:hypothetical protein